QNDQTIASASLAVGVKLSDILEIAAIPSISQKKFDERPARETDGSKSGVIGNAPPSELITNDIRPELRLNTGSFSLLPYVETGIQMDQGSGGEDFAKTGAGLTASLTIVPSINLQLSGACGKKKMSYENWTYIVQSASTERIDDESEGSVKLSI